MNPPKLANMIMGGIGLTLIAGVGLTYVNNRPPEPAPVSRPMPEPANMEPGAALATAIRDSLDHSPEDWTKDDIAIRNSKRKVALVYGVEENAQNLLVLIDGERMPSFGHGFAQATRSQVEVHDALQRWLERTQDRRKFNQEIRQQKAMERFLNEDQ